MGNQLDLVVGQIRSLFTDSAASWEAFHRADYENSKLKDEIMRLKKIIRQLRRKKK